MKYIQSLQILDKINMPGQQIIQEIIPEKILQIRFMIRKSFCQATFVLLKKIKRE